LSKAAAKSRINPSDALIYSRARLLQATCCVAPRALDLAQSGIHVKKVLGQQFIDWIVSAEGQKAIADYKINGQQLFFANAKEAGA